MNSTSKTHPRVLILAGSVPRKIAQAVPLTLYHLFEDWPPDKLAVLTDSHIQPDTNLYRYYFRMDALSPLFCALFSPLCTTPTPPALAQSSAGVISVYRRFAELRPGTSNRKTRAKRATSYVSRLFPFHVPPLFWDWLKRFSPDVIYLVPNGFMRPLDLAIRIAETMGIPIFPHFLDDAMLGGAFNGTALRRLLFRRRYFRQLNHMMSLAPVGGCISDAMGQEYSDKFGVRFVSLMNTAEVPAVFPKQDACSVASNHFMYIGQLTRGRCDSLLDIADALAELQDVYSISADILVYTGADDISTFGARLRESPKISVRGSLLPHEVAAAYGNCISPIHVEGFGDDDISFARLSISTKIPTILALGMCMFAYGPSEVASIQYLRENHAAIVVDERSPELLKKSLKNAIVDSCIHDNIAHNAWALAREQHHAPSIREGLRATLCEVMKDHVFEEI